MTPPRAFALLLPLIALAACDRSEPEAEGPSVQRVLPGTVSDAMLQTDRMQAQAPMAEPIATGVPGEEDEPGAGVTAPRAGGARPSPQAARPGDPASPAAAASPAPSPPEQAPASPGQKTAASPGEQPSN